VRCVMAAVGFRLERIAHNLAGCGLIGAEAPSAAWRSAAESTAGSSRPRLAARRMIPAQAFGLKKYRCGTSPVSKMSDKEQALAPLRHSEPLRVQACPCATIPEFIHLPDEGTKVPSVS